MNARTLVVIAALVAGSLVISSADGRKFYPDDPIQIDPEVQDAGSMTRLRASQQFDFVENSFLGAGDKTDKRAVNVNTIDEVPDSSWFTNRLGRETWPIDRAVKEPDTVAGPAPGPWTIIAAKSEGITPGFTIKDSTGETYFLKFDPPSNPEMASGAEVISTKFFHALGYNTAENYIAVMRPETLTIRPGTMIDDKGSEHEMKQRDIRELLKKAARLPDGSYRVLASRAIPYPEVGRFRYYGTRPDDPNDIHPHEHRRELRGMLVFAAWLNHDDSRSINTFDVLVKTPERSIVRHYLLDFGSTLGSGSTQSQSTRAGNEFLWEARPTLVTMLTLGFYVRPWIKVDYPDLPAIGRFESTYFQPELWKPEYPNAAFSNARPEDKFWGARILSTVSDDMVRAVVGTARFTDPKASEYLTQTLVERKRKSLAAWLNGTNPVINVKLGSDGALSFANAAVDAGVANAATHYTLSWSRFDNSTSTHTAVGEEQTVTTTSAQAPAALLSDGGEYISVRIRAFDPARPTWQHPLVAYFRRASGSWSLVGLERNP
jgi:hypothetical protein